MNSSRIMIVEERPTHRERLREILLRQEYRVVEANDPVELLPVYQLRNPALIIVCSTSETSCDGLDIVELIRDIDKSIPLILITLRSSEERAISALKLGVDDYFKWPINYSELLKSIKRNLTIPHVQTGSAKLSADQRSSDYILVGNSQPMQSIKNYVPKVGAADCPVLITGQTGTGKECVARQIHKFSPRRKRPFVCINCAALPDSLVESELFGFEQGAFTGANSSYQGKLKQADGGSLFFDEVGDMSPYTQAKVLRVFENKEVTPLRAKKSTPVDIRIITATNQNLKQMVDEHKFREDLYYRINVTNIHLPPLKERKEDILSLVAHYLLKLNTRYHKDVHGFTDEAVQCLLHYHWPGNVRELKNVLEAIFVAQSSPNITLQHLPQSIRQCFIPAAESLHEKELLLSALSVTNWNKSKAAEKLHWSRMTVYRKMNKYHIVQSQSRDATNSI